MDPGGRLRSQKSARLVLGAAFVLAGAGLLAWVLRFYANVVFVDGMQLLPTVADYFSGKLSLEKLFIPYGEHRIPLYRLLLVANSAWFGLNMYVDPALTASASLVTAGLLYPAFRRSLAPALAPGAIAFAFLPVLAVSVSLAYPPLMFMSTQFQLGSVLVLLVGVLLYGSGREPSGSRLAVCAGLVIAYFGLFSGGYFPGLLASLAAVFAARWALERKAPSKGEWGLLLLSFACAAIYSRTILRETGLGAPLTAKLWGVFGHPGFTIRFLLGGLAASVACLPPGISSTPLAVVALLLGSAVLAALAAGAWLFRQSQMWRRTYLPVWMLAYSLGIIGAVRVGRGDGGWTWMMNDWYAFHLKFLPLAVFWILLYSVSNGRPVLASGSGWVPSKAGVQRWRPWRLESLALMGFALLLASTWLFSNGRQWARGPRHKLKDEARRQAMLSPGYTNKPIEEVLLVSRPEAATGLGILVKHRLNVFHDFAPDGAALASMTGLPSVDANCHHLDEATKAGGWLGDGWIERVASLKLRSGPVGLVELSAYMPEELFREVYRGELRVDLFADGDRVSSRLLSAPTFGGGGFTLEGRIPPGKLLSLEIRVSKSFVPKEHAGSSGDSRDLAIRITDLVWD